MLNAAEFLCYLSYSLGLYFSPCDCNGGEVIFNVVHTGYLDILHVKYLGDFAVVIVAEHTVISQECAVFGLFKAAEICKLTSHQRGKVTGSFVVVAQHRS